MGQQKLRKNEATEPRPNAKRRSRNVGEIGITARKNMEITVLSAPALIVFLGFVILPVILAMYYGFFKWKGFGTPSANGTFIGFEN